MTSQIMTGKITNDTRHVWQRVQTYLLSQNFLRVTPPQQPMISVNSALSIITDQLTDRQSKPTIKTNPHLLEQCIHRVDQHMKQFGPLADTSDTNNVSQKQEQQKALQEAEIASNQPLTIPKPPRTEKEKKKRKGERELDVCTITCTHDRNGNVYVLMGKQDQITTVTLNEDKMPTSNRAYLVAQMKAAKRSATRSMGLTWDKISPHVSFHITPFTHRILHEGTT